VPWFVILLRHSYKEESPPRTRVTGAHDEWNNFAANQCQKRMKPSCERKDDGFVPLHQNPHRLPRRGCGTGTSYDVFGWRGQMCRAPSGMAGQLGRYPNEFTTFQKESQT
jgi:hypothetical protein